MVSFREITLQRIGEESAPSRIWMVSWHYSGNFLASCGDDKAVRIWTFNQDSKPHLDCRTTLDDSHTRTIRCVNFSHCGKLLASSSFDASIVIYQQEDGDYSEVNKLEGHESEVKWCAFSPSDEFLATCSRDKSVWFWQVDEDDDFNVSSILQPHTQDVKFVVWHPNEDLLVSCSYDFSIRFFRYDGEDWVTQQKIDKAHDGTVWSAAFDADGHRLITVGEDHVIQIWRRENVGAKSATADTWKSVAKYLVEDTRWPLYSVSWNHVTGLVATAGGDSKIRIFQVAGSADDERIEPLGVWSGHDGEVNCVAWCPAADKANILASASDDGSVRLLQVEL
ncbi:unnamed protein product [Caenorhabditis auriculariae]|uniref:Probable cytosolic iron-sulfur protein assembly protein CIAO1 homolog n=1 Tax=Caenorhabditis auriculariae TaxID=2777116 RepID=A0A8S1GM87_9PELO|nr:unnamed protein product [Caenorhabditis auriculariae]